MDNTTRLIIFLVLLLAVIVYLIINLWRPKGRDEDDFEYQFARRLKLVTVMGLIVILCVVLYYLVVSVP